MLILRPIHNTGGRGVFHYPTCRLLLKFFKTSIIKEEQNTSHV